MEYWPFFLYWNFLNLRQAQLTFLAFSARLRIWLTGLWTTRRVDEATHAGLILGPLKIKRPKSILPPPTITKIWFSSYNYKTGYFTSLNFSNRAFYLPRAVLKAVCYSNRSFVFFFFKKISIESLKNHSKSQKNHKIKNPILLDSTWVNIRSEYIIWYTLVQFFYCNFRYILFCN